MQLHYNKSHRARTVFTNHNCCKNTEEKSDDILCQKFASPDTKGESHLLNDNVVTTPLLIENAEALQNNEHISMHEKQQDEILFSQLLRRTNENNNKSKSSPLQ